MPSVVVCGRGSRASSPKSTQPGSNKQHLSRAVRSREAGRSSPPSVALQSPGRRPGAGSPLAASCQRANAQQMFPSLLARSPDPSRNKPKPGMGTCLRPTCVKCSNRKRDKRLLAPGVLAEGLVVSHRWRRRKKRGRRKKPAVQRERDPGSRTWRFRGTFHPHRRRKTEHLIAAVVEQPRNCRFCLAHLTGWYQEDWLTQRNQECRPFRELLL